jgi:hypothetical protein
MVSATFVDTGFTPHHRLVHFAFWLRCLIYKVHALSEQLIYITTALSPCQDFFLNSAPLRGSSSALIEFPLSRTAFID